MNLLDSYELNLIEKNEINLKEEIKKLKEYEKNDLRNFNPIQEKLYEYKDTKESDLSKYLRYKFIFQETIRDKTELDENYAWGNN